MSVGLELQFSILVFLGESILLNQLVGLPSFNKIESKQSLLIPIPVAGAIIQYGSYKIAFYSMGGAFGLTFLLILLWMPETAFDRANARSVNLDVGSNNVRFSVPHSEHNEANFT